MEHALSGDEGYYAAPEQICDITTALFHYHVPLLAAPGGYITYRGS